MKQMQYYRFLCGMPVAEKASTAPPEHVQITTLATSLAEARELARDAGLVLHGQVMQDGTVKPC